MNMRKLLVGGGWGKVIFRKYKRLLSALNNFCMQQKPPTSRLVFLFLCQLTKDFPYQTSLSKKKKKNEEYQLEVIVVSLSG